MDSEPLESLLAGDGTAQLSSAQHGTDQLAVGLACFLVLVGLVETEFGAACCSNVLSVG